MAEPMLTVDVDADALVAALEHLGATVEVYALDAAHETAEAIAAEAGRRVRRRTGHTAQQIRVEPMESATQKGFIVRANDPATKTHVDLWLEFGTSKMTARPFLFNSARLEEGNHYQRIVAAVERARDEQGLGA